jgi:hypothetical protein
MESLIAISILCKIIGFLLCMFLLYKLLKYVGFERSALVFSVIAHFLGGYLMFFS